MSELKTLNDLPCSDNAELSCCEDVGKTGQPHAVSVQYMHLEALNWFKMLSFDFQLANNKHHDAFYKGNNDAHHINKCVMCWIKHFFNLTKADLK